MYRKSIAEDCCITRNLADDCCRTSDLMGDQVYGIKSFHLILYHFYYSGVVSDGFPRSLVL